MPELTERAPGFARVGPEQKLKLVRALQSRGDIVAIRPTAVGTTQALQACVADWFTL